MWSPMFILPGKAGSQSITRRLPGPPSQGAGLLAAGSSTGGHQMQAGSGRGLHPVEVLVGRARQGLRQRLGVELGVGEGKGLRGGWLRRGLRDQSQGVTQNVREKKNQAMSHTVGTERLSLHLGREGNH